MEKIYSKLQCKLHFKQIKTFCTLEECKNQQLCSECFILHEPYHMKFLRHIDEVDRQQLNKHMIEYYEINRLSKSDIESMCKFNLCQLEQTITVILDDLRESLWENYSKLIINKTDEFKSLIIPKVEEVDVLFEIIKKNDQQNNIESNFLALEEKCGHIKAQHIIALDNLHKIQDGLGRLNVKAKEVYLANFYIPFKVDIKLIEFKKFQNNCKILFNSFESSCFLLVREQNKIRLKNCVGIINNSSKLLKKEYLLEISENLNSVVSIRNLVYIISTSFNFFKYHLNGDDFNFSKSIELPKENIKKHCMISYKEDIIIISTTPSDYIKISFYNAKLVKFKEVETSSKIISNFSAFELNDNIFIINLDDGKIEYFYLMKDERCYKINFEIMKNIDSVSYDEGKLYVVDKSSNLNIFKLTCDYK